MSDQEQKFPPQHQDHQPGLEHEMTPKPQAQAPHYQGSGKLNGKVALISGGDSGIGRAVAVLFAREGADVAILYLDEHEDAQETQRLVEAEGRACIAIAGDIGEPAFCRSAVQQVIERFDHLDVLVNNAAEQHICEDIAEISPEQVERTFRTNIFSMFYLTAAAAAHLREGSSIINSTSVTAYHGNPMLVDYASTKGAIVTFTRSLALQLVNKGIRVNGVAPGPVWTPLIPASFPDEKITQFGANTPMKRAGQPEEIAPCYVFLASRDASFMTGQVLHPNGGQIVNG